MSLAPHLRVPELLAGVDVRTLPLTALEGFVLSRIDGKSNVADIVALTGLPQEQVGAILDKLQGLGALGYRPEGVAEGASGGGQKRAGAGPSTGLHASPGAGRRRISHGPGSQPRRVFSESSISSPPPELPPQSNRPRGPSEWANPPTSRTHSLPPQQSSRSLPPQQPSRPPAARRPSDPQPRQTTPPGTQTKAPPAGPLRSDVAPERTGMNSARPAGAASMRAPSMGPLSGPPSATMGPPAEPTGASFAPSIAPVEPAYDPRELEEDVDLSLERRRQVLDLYYRLSTLDYYEALGVSYRADKKEIRSAYFALSKLLHPDSMFRKKLGSFKPKMEAVFNYLTEGYETLGKKKNRDEYDAYLRATKAARMAERALLFEPNAPPADGLHVPPPPLLPEISESPASQSSEPPPAATREVSNEARKLAQEVIARRLRGAVSARHSEPVRAPPQAPAAGAGAPAGSAFDGQQPKTDTQTLLKRLTRTLRDVGQLTGGSDRVTRAVRASQAAFARGDLGEATQQAARAAALAPERPELKMEHSRLSALLSEKLANDYIAQANFEMKHGKWASAALSWVKVCEGRPSDARAHFHAAQSLLKAGGELRGAQKYAQKAIFLAPSDIEARILLAQIYLTVGLKLNARRELDAAAKLDPANEMVKNLLADLEKG